MIQGLLTELFFFLGNINQSLMTLRTCIEVLRENQLYGTNKVGIPSLIILEFDALDKENSLGSSVAVIPRWFRTEIPN